MNTHPFRRQIIKALLRCLSLVAVLLTLAVFYLAVIIGQPADEQLSAVQTSPVPREPAAAKAPVTITAEHDIASLLDSFPAAFIRLAPGHDAVLLTGRTYDTAYGGGFARELELTYRLPDGMEVMLRSIYPSDAYALIPTQDYSLSAHSGYSMLHLPAARMDSDRDMRFHARGEGALYLFTLPADAEDAAALIKLAVLEIPLT
jgi:hypothetical protein